jgi:hypothetical protein
MGKSKSSLDVLLGKKIDIHSSVFGVKISRAAVQRKLNWNPI